MRTPRWESEAHAIFLDKFKQRCFSVSLDCSKEFLQNPPARIIKRFSNCHETHFIRETFTVVICECGYVGHWICSRKQFKLNVTVNDIKI